MKNARKSAIWSDHREPPNTFLAHEPHCEVEIIVDSAADDLAGHHAVNSQRFNSFTLGVGSHADIPIGQKPYGFRLRVYNRHSAAGILSHGLRGFAQRVPKTTDLDRAIHHLFDFHDDLRL